jgi:hypothetical protein
LVRRASFGFPKWEGSLKSRRQRSNERANFANFSIREPRRAANSQVALACSRISFLECLDHRV